MDEVDQLVGTPAEVGTRQAEVATVDDDVLADRQLHVERVLLRHDAQSSADVGAIRDRVKAENAQRPARRRRNAPDHPHGRCLAGAVRPEETESFPAFDVEVDAVDRHELAETLHQSAGMHERQLSGCTHHPFNLPTSADIGAIASVAMQAAVAGGHPATVAAGIEILEDGGNAADAAVAASLASCVSETVMTGLLGGGHAVYFEAATGRVRNLDCFVAVPGLG